MLSQQARPQASGNNAQTVTLPSSFATPSFSVSNTFTPITTFATPEDTRPTTIFGTNADGTAYSFSYNVPATAVPTVSKSGLDATLASEGYPTSQGDLSPPTQHLQNANKGAPQAGRNMAPGLSLAAFVATAAGAGAAMLLM